MLQLTLEIPSPVFTKPVTTPRRSIGKLLIVEATPPTPTSAEPRFMAIEQKQSRAVAEAGVNSPNQPFTMAPVSPARPEPRARSESEPEPEPESQSLWGYTEADEEAERAAALAHPRAEGVVDPGAVQPLL